MSAGSPEPPEMARAQNTADGRELTHCEDTTTHLPPPGPCGPYTSARSGHPQRPPRRPRSPSISRLRSRLGLAGPGCVGMAGGSGGGEVIAWGHSPGNHNYMRTQKQDEAASPPEQIRGWFTGRLPDDWFEGAPEILIDREEITVIGHLPSPAAPAGGPARWRRPGPRLDEPRRRCPPMWVSSFGWPYTLPT
jgi:hypothetical protein